MEKNDFETVRGEPQYVRFGSILERSIQKGLLEKGTVLLEGPLSELLGSSRAPVRRALVQLNQEGLVRRFAGRGYVVGPAGPICRIELTPAMLDIDVDHQGLRKSFAWERIYEAVERAIIHRSVFGRFRINELELARHYGVGRTVARDVLTRLQTLGMLEKDDRQRWMIVPLDRARLIDLYEIRQHLEPLALGRALPLLGAEMLRAMRRQLTAMIDAYPRVTAAAMDELEIDLHVRCLILCRNRELLVALRRTRCVLTLSKHVLGVEMTLPDHDPFMAEHLEVIDAMLANARTRALQALRRHLRSSCPKVVERLEFLRRTFRPPETTYIGRPFDRDDDRPRSWAGGRGHARAGEAG